MSASNSQPNSQPKNKRKFKKSKQTALPATDTTALAGNGAGTSDPESGSQKKQKPEREARKLDAAVNADDSLTHIEVQSETAAQARTCADYKHETDSSNVISLVTPPQSPHETGTGESVKPVGPPGPPPVATPLGPRAPSLLDSKHSRETPSAAAAPATSVPTVARQPVTPPPLNRTLAESTGATPEMKKMQVREPKAEVSAPSSSAAASSAAPAVPYATEYDKKAARARDEVFGLAALTDDERGKALLQISVKIKEIEAEMSAGRKRRAEGNQKVKADAENLKEAILAEANAAVKEKQNAMWDAQRLKNEELDRVQRALFLKRANGKVAILESAADKPVREFFTVPDGLSKEQFESKFRALKEEYPQHTGVFMRAEEKSLEPAAAGAAANTSVGTAAPAAAGAPTSSSKPVARQLWPNTVPHMEWNQLRFGATCYSCKTPNHHWRTDWTWVRPAKTARVFVCPVLSTQYDVPAAPAAPQFTLPSLPTDEVQQPVAASATANTEELF